MIWGAGLCNIVMWGARGPSVMHTGSLVTVDSELSNDAHIFERLFRQADKTF